MILEMFILFLAFIGVYLLDRHYRGDGKKLPPGPFQWPLIGNIVQVGNAHPKFAHLALHSLVKKYGEIMSLKFGAHKSGVIFMSGDLWKESRRYTMRALHELGFGKRSSMEAIMTEELNEFMDMLCDKTAGHAEGIVTINPDLFAPSIVNLVWSYVTGSRFPHNDKNVIKMIDLTSDVVAAMNFSYLSTLFPILRKWFPGLTGVPKDAETYKRLQDFMRDLIAQFRNDLDERGKNAESTTLVEAYLREIENHKGESNEQTIFTEEHLIMLLNDLFMGGSETTSNTLTFTILFMVRHPEIQKRVQDEIAKVVKDGEFISMSYLEKMPYTEAVMLEISRIACIVPIHYRTAVTDMEYNNYKIPKGTCVFFSLYSVLMDENYWGDPKVFRPERFLNKTGIKVVNKERVIPFGYGKRVCLGESLARNSYFVFFTTLLRRFSFYQPPGLPLPGVEPQESFTMKPFDFNVLIRLNKSSN